MARLWLGKHTSGGGASGRSHWGSPGRRASLITAAETMSGNDAQDPSASNDNSYIIQHLSLGCTVISSLARGLSVAVRWWPHNRKALILSLRSAAASMTSPAKRGEGREGGEGRKRKKKCSAAGLFYLVQKKRKKEGEKKKPFQFVKTRLTQNLTPGRGK